jgi:type IV secretion system protein VirB4
LPGHVYANVRQPPISTLNLAHMIPLSAVWAGPERDEHFGAPLLFGKTEGSTPFRFSLHVGDVGHTLIVGPTGAGKSVLLALMALQFRRYRRRSSPSTSAARSAPPRSPCAATGTISAAA